MHRIDPEECQKVKEKLILHLEKHRVPLELSGATDIVIAGVVTCTPPYSITSCLSTNDIVLGRIQSILKTFDPL